MDRLKLPLLTVALVSHPKERSPARCPRVIERAEVGGAKRAAACLVAGLALLLGPEAAAQETAYFTDVTATHLPEDSAAHILDIDLGDVDGDGDLDAVGALENDANRLYLNDGTGHFTWKRGAFSEQERDSEEVELADFDGDGHLDAVFIAENEGLHEFYLGHGDGTFGEVSDRLPRRSVANDGEAADVDGDGHTDLVVSSTGGRPPEAGEEQPD